MSLSLQRLLLARLHMFRIEEGGRRFPFMSDYCPDWDLGNTFEGRNAFDGARVYLEGREQMFPGEEGVVLLIPIIGERWRHVTLGMRIPMYEGGRRIGMAVVLEVIDSS